MLRHEQNIIYSKLVRQSLYVCLLSFESKNIDEEMYKKADHSEKHFLLKERYFELGKTPSQIIVHRSN